MPDDMIPRGRPPYTGVEIPTFESKEAERDHAKIRLAATFRIFARQGFVEGVAGHVTLRDPVRPDHFWVNPFGQHFAQVRVRDLILVNHEGEVVEGAGKVNRAAFAIHASVHKARPDVIAAAHTHSTYGRAWSALGRKLDPISQDACAFYEDHGLFDDYTGLVWEKSEGERIGKALGPHKAVILQNHGLLTVGGSVDAAAFWFLFMESACRAQLLAEAAGEVKHITPDNAKLTYGQLGHDVAGWFQFQPLFDRILELEPDLAD